MPRKLWTDEKRRKHPQSFTRWVLVWIESCRLRGHLLENAVLFSKRVLGMNSQSGNRSDLSRIMPGGIDLQTLIKSKSTEREQDKVDVQRLRSLSRSE